MVFKHNKQPFSDNDPYQFAYKHLRQLDCGGQLASFAEFSSFRGIPEKQPISDGEREGMFSQSQDEVRLGAEADNVLSVINNREFKNEASDIPTDGAASALGDASKLSWVTSSTSDVVRPEHCKRPSSDDRSYQAAFKRIRQVDQNSQVDSSAEIAPFSSPFEGPPTSVFSVAVGEEVEKRKTAAVSEDLGKNTPNSFLSSPRFTCSKTEEYTRLELPVRLSFFPGYFEDGHRTTGFNQPEEIYSPVFDYPHRKLVAIGPNHQADVPLWGSQGIKNSFGESDDCVSSSLTSVTCSASGVSLFIDEDDSDRLMGTCVMSMPDWDLLALEGVGNRNIECDCLDEGSIRCVRQHVMEAREKLKKVLGQDRFVELGFCDMGEDVAHKWTEEEEHLFHEVVLSNPASMGKNFWDELPQVFPSRSSKELVSYYFNVFMLRKRAEQNRSDPLHVDSDNDEWQDSDDGEFATTEEDDEDSVVESPADRDEMTCNNDGPAEVDIHEEAEDGDDCDDSAIAGEDDEEFYGVSEGCISDKSKFVPKVHSMDKNSQDGGEDQDIQDDSCTSYEGQHNRVDSYGGPVDFVGMQDGLVEHREYRISGISDHEYIVGHCDPKPWEISYIHGAPKDVDLLPTCNVIEEVFGKGSWEK